MVVIKRKKLKESSMENLDLYARIEPMIGFYDAYESLYDTYIDLIAKLDVRRLLDVGCGNGKLLERLSQRYDATGIDISAQMVEIARAKGLDARHCELHAVGEKFDLIVAVADVLNYMPEATLATFLEDVQRHLHAGGYFMCDINTLHGFEDVAAGSMIVDEAERFLAIDASFDEGILETEMTLFTQKGSCFEKEQATILQYYHTIDEIAALSPMRLIGMHDVALFSTQSDKTILLFQKL